MISNLIYGYYYSLSVREWWLRLIPSDCPALCIFLASPPRQQSGIEYTTDSTGVMRISVWANGADGVDGKFILLPFLLFGAPRKQFRIWNFVTKVFSTVPSSSLKIDGLSRVWPISQPGIAVGGRAHSPCAMQSLAVYARIQEDCRFSTFAPKAVEKRLV